LIYVNEELANFENKLPLRIYSSFDSGNINDYYTQILAETSIFKEIETDNMKFLQEVDEFSIRTQIKFIFEDYQREFQYINEIERKLKEKIEKEKHENNKKIPLNPALNFAIYLRFHKANKDKNLESLVKWHILNHCLLTICPELKSLEKFNDFPPIWQEKLKEQLNKLSKLNKFKSVDLDINIDFYHSLLNEYAEITCHISISTYFMKKAVEGNLKESVYAAIYLKNMIVNLQNVQNQFFEKFNVEFFKIIAIFLCSKLHENLKMEKLAEVSYFFDEFLL